MKLTLNAYDVIGLGSYEKEQLKELIDVLNSHVTSNAIKSKYYEGHIRLADVNLGIALPEKFNLEIACEWGAKTVDVLASRSIFDGFVGKNGEDTGTLRDISESNRLIAEYVKACKDELKYGCTFATLSADEKIGCRIRFHSSLTASALWNGEKGRVDCGLAIIDTVKDESKAGAWQPSLINLYTDCLLYTSDAADD